MCRRIVHVGFFLDASLFLDPLSLDIVTSTSWSLVRTTSSAWVFCAFCVCAFLPAFSVFQCALYGFLPCLIFILVWLIFPSLCLVTPRPPFPPGLPFSFIQPSDNSCSLPIHSLPAFVRHPPLASWILGCAAPFARCPFLLTYNLHLSTVDPWPPQLITFCTVYVPLRIYFHGSGLFLVFASLVDLFFRLFVEGEEVFFWAVHHSSWLDFGSGFWSSLAYAFPSGSTPRWLSQRERQAAG